MKRFKEEPPYLDCLSLYKEDIGAPLLTHEQEIALGRQIAAGRETLV